MNKFDTVKGYSLIILEFLIALCLLIINTFLSQMEEYKVIIGWGVFWLLILDIFIKCYSKYKNRKNETDLKKENEKKHKEISTNLKSIKHEYAEQKKFNIEYKEKTERYLKVLNKFFSESLLNEKDILKLAKSAQYFTLYVYSWPFKNELKKYKFETKRQYPIFLEELGFIRKGVRNTFFIINKDKLKQKRLHNIVEFKKFLINNFEKIRKKDFNLYLEEV